jgi:hypothetical protein
MWISVVLMMENGPFKVNRHGAHENYGDDIAQSAGAFRILVNGRLLDVFL